MRKPRELATIAPDPVASAKSAGLRYVSDERPGITRKSAGKTFAYFGTDGKRITEEKTLGRIKRLAIPPAWTEVWICPLENGHLQATGRDVRGRKQYRYHADWREARDETKYERVLAFGRALPKIRQRVARDLKQRGLPRNKVLAAMVRLLETTLIRVGNDEYAKENHSFGLSTMLDRHAKIQHGTIHFDFRGKSGKQHTIDLHDPQLAQIVRQVQDLPGQELFQYVDEDGKPQDITSQDVNDYLRETAGEEFSAKDFRTWSGTVLAAIALREFEKFDTKAQAKKNLVEAIKHVSERLGNTPAICKKCYIHPIVMNSYLDGTTVEMLRQKTEKTLRNEITRLKPEESAVLAFLQQRLAQSEKPSLETALKRSLKQTRKRSAKHAPEKSTK
ncbi:MAG: DNA topoisomerase IB [Nibricoccus sp.]